METLNSSGNSCSSRNASPWHLLEQGELRWDEFSNRERNEIVQHYSPKIKILGLRLKNKLPKSIDLSELISAGSLGLMEALGKFDPKMGIKFETYAENRIKGAMLDELRRMDWFSRGLRQRVRLVDETTRRIESETGETPSLEQLCEATGLKSKDVDAAREILQNQLCLSLEAISENFVSSKLNQQENDPLQQTVFNEMVDKVASLIDELTPREKLVLSLYYGEELNMRETAEVMEITEGRISQLHSQALAKLRKKFRAQHGVETL